MIRRHIIMGTLAASIALSGCGGGDDSSPTPTPTSTPTPTPTASPTYAAFPLSAAAEFFTFNAATSFTGNPAAGAVTLGAASTEALSTRVRLATSNAIGTATTEYVVRSNTEESRFTPAKLITQPVPANVEFVFRTDDAATAGKFSQLEFLNNTISATTKTTEPLLGSLTRVSYANWYRGDSTAGEKRLAYTVFGYPTVTTDLPTTGTVSYNARVTGRLVSVAGAATAVNKVAGTVTLSINFATGQVDATFVLTQGPTGTESAYGTFTAQAAIPVGSNQFLGAFTTGSPLSGTLAGGCFGSQCEEVGLTFAASGTNGGATQRLVGVVVSKKQ